MNAGIRVRLGALALCPLFATSRARADANDGTEVNAPAVEHATDATPIASPIASPVATKPAPRESAVQLHLDAAAGVSTAGVLVGGLGLVRYGLLEVGASFGFSGLFSARTGGGIAVGGGGHRPGGGGWDVLLELGMNQHHVMGHGGLLSSDPGASGTIPYGGLRAGIDWSFGNVSEVAHPTLGLWLFARADLAEHAGSYAYQRDDWWSGRSGASSGSVTLGGGAEIGIALAGGLDLLP